MAMWPQKLPYILDQGDKPISNPSPTNIKTEIEELIIFADGASQGNPGEAGAGVVITDEKGNIIEELKYFLGKTTNNVAEYRALIFALEKARRIKARRLKIFMDSELIVRQIKGEYKVKDLKLKTLYQEVWKLLQKFPEYTINYIAREKNKRADQLAKEAISTNSPSRPK